MGVKRQSSRFQKENLRQIEGRNSVLEALRAGSVVHKIYIEEKMGADERVQEILDRAKQSQIEIIRTQSKKLIRMSKTGANHQGIIAQADFHEEPDIRQLVAEIRQTKKAPLFLVVPEVLYERNLGAILRTAEATKVDAVIINNRGHKLTPVVSKTAVGAGEYIPLIHENIFTTLKFFKQEGIWIYGLKEGDSKRIYNVDFTKPTALVIGAEDTGISISVAKYIDQLISIPMLGHIESLNMSVAASICLYEVVRQRKYK
jgi:23S rRNA (guanosine2251-2'-O)-methyltransferase